MSTHNEDLIKAQDVFLSGINQICGKFGLNNVMAQLYAILYFSSKSLSLNEMVDRLKISKGCVSVNIRALERYNAVRRVWVKGSRKDYYAAEADIYKVIIDRIKSMAQGRLSEVENMVNSSYEAINSVNCSTGEERDTLKIFRQRLDKLKNLHNRAQSLFNLFNSGLLGNVLNTKLEKEYSGLAEKDLT